MPFVDCADEESKLREQARISLYCNNIGLDEFFKCMPAPPESSRRNMEIPRVAMSGPD
jgi:hypothetical protein